jgi:hypothetical protein
MATTDSAAGRSSHHCTTTGHAASSCHGALAGPRRVSSPIWPTSIQAAGGNIVELDQHTDVVEGDFGCRIEVAGGVDAWRSQLGAWTTCGVRSPMDFTMTPLLQTSRAGGRAVLVDAALPERPHRAERDRAVGL